MGLKKEKVGTYPLLKINLLYHRDLRDEKKWVRIFRGMNDI